MAIRSSLRCEIRAVVPHLWPDEIKVHPHVRVLIPVGRRGQPVQKEAPLHAPGPCAQGGPQPAGHLWRHGVGDPSPRWLATMVCRPAGQRAAIGLGLPPDFVQRSRVRRLGINPDDWPGPVVGEGPGPCAALWRPYQASDSGEGP
jgi:hypothetical protein